MLRSVVPKPELKYYDNLQNGVITSLSSSFQYNVDWLNAFAIPQGAGLGNRIGDSVQVKMIEVHFELSPPASAVRTATQTAGGAALFGNAINQNQLDLAARFTIVDTNVKANVPVSGLELMGNTQSASPGGASSYHQQLDKLVLARQKRQIRKDSKYMHSRGVWTSTDALSPATGLAPFGIGHATYRVGEHSFSMKFPGKGYKLQFDSNNQEPPVRMPVLWHVGKNGFTTENPRLRWKTVRIWYTDA